MNLKNLRILILTQITLCAQFALIEFTNSRCGFLARHRIPRSVNTSLSQIGGLRSSPEINKLG